MKILILNRPLQAPVSVSDRVDLMADSSTVLPGKPIFLPDDGEGFSGALLPAFRISRLGRSIASKFASRYYDAFTFVLRVFPPVNKAIPEGSAIAVAFDSALSVGQWTAVDNLPEIINLRSNALGSPVTFPREELIIDETIAMLSRYFTLKNGDIIIPSMSPAPIFPLTVDTRVNGVVDDVQLLDVKIK